MSDSKELVERLRYHKQPNATAYVEQDCTEAVSAIEALEAEVERLKRSEDGLLKTLGLERREKHAAQTERDRLMAENARLKEALSRFASIKADDGDTFDTYDDQVVIRCEITVADLREARKALEPKP